MLGGRADNLPVKPWSLAVDALIYSADHIRTLLVLFAVPEGIRVAAYFVNEKKNPASESTEYLPTWAMDLMSYAVSAVIITSVIRYVVLGRPQLLPNRELMRNYLLTAVVLSVAMSIVNFLTNDSRFTEFYVRLFMSEERDEWRLHLWSIAYYTGGFLISSVLVAAAYPSLGMTAVGGQFSPHRALLWNRKYFWRVLALTLFVMSACLALRRAYGAVLGILTPNATGVGYAQDPNLNALIIQLTYVPMDFLFDVIPAVAVGLLYRVLKANSADL